MSDFFYYITGSLLTVAYLAATGFISFAWSEGDEQIASRFGTLFVVIYFLLLYIGTTLI